MPHSLRAKIKGLRYKGIITDKDCDRLCKALDNEDVLDDIREEIERLHYHPKLDFIKNDEVVDMALEIIDKYAEQEPLDTWSIKDVADTFKKHGIIREQEPCDDAISREELLKAIDTWDKFGYTETGCFVRITKEIDNYVPYVHLEDVITAIQKLPPVTQKPETVTEFADRCRECGAKYGKLLKQKSGKWIEMDGYDGDVYYDCSERKPCINYSDGCEEWAGCPCVYYKAESEE